MAFTDDNLKRWKEWIGDDPKDETFQTTDATVGALLARLEAAEKYIECLEDAGGPEYVGPELSDTTNRANSAWLTAAGKE